MAQQWKAQTTLGEGLSSRPSAFIGQFIMAYNFTSRGIWCSFLASVVIALTCTDSCSHVIHKHIYIWLKMKSQTIKPNIDRGVGIEDLPLPQPPGIYCSWGHRYSGRYRLFASTTWMWDQKVPLPSCVASGNSWNLPGLYSSVAKLVASCCEGQWGTSHSTFHVDGTPAMLVLGRGDKSWLTSPKLCFENPVKPHRGITM